MVRNVGNVDRWIRLVLGAALLYGAFVTWGAALGYILFIVGGILAFTAIFGMCPLYSVLHINTCKRPLNP